VSYMYIFLAYHSVSVIFFFFLNEIRFFLLQILLQDRYTIDVLTVIIEFKWKNEV
jgi:hypothetical protein